MCGITTSVDQQVNVVGVTLGDAQRVDAVARFEHDVAVAPQHLARERPHGVLVLDEQHRLPAVRVSRCAPCRQRLRAGRRPRPAAGTTLKTVPCPGSLYTQM